MEKTTLPAIIIKLFFAILILLILSFVYVYITALNPLVYFNFILWFFYSALLILPVSLFAKESISKVFMSLIISSVAIYLIYGMKSSIFFETYAYAFKNGGSTWIPKVNFVEMFSSLLSYDAYNDKLDFLLKVDTLNLSYKFRKAQDTGTGFTNFVRIIECLGIYFIPIYLMFKKDKNKS